MKTMLHTPVVHSAHATAGHAGAHRAMPRLLAGAFGLVIAASLLAGCALQPGRAYDLSQWHGQTSFDQPTVSYSQNGYPTYYPR